MKINHTYKLQYRVLVLVRGSASWIDSGHILFDIDPDINWQCKWKHNCEALWKTIQVITLQGRISRQHLAAKLGLLLTTTYHLMTPRWLKCTEWQDRNIDSGVILQKHTNPLKPTLDKVQMYCWSLYCWYQVGLLGGKVPCWKGE